MKRKGEALTGGAGAWGAVSVIWAFMMEEKGALIKGFKQRG